MAIAGKVAITPGYEWSASVAYDKLVVVTYNNNVYLSTKPSTGIEPTNEEYWMLLIENVTAEDLEELQTTVESILNGTTPAGDSKLLEGLTAEEVGASGAKNLWKYPYYRTSRSEYGLDWIDNGNGTLTVHGVSTAIANFVMIHRNEKKHISEPGTILTLSGGYSSDIRIQINFYDSSDTIIYQVSCTGTGTTFEVPMDSTYVEAYIRVTSGITINNLTVYPMLELGSVAHDWVPYHIGGAEHALNADVAEHALDADTVDGLQGGSIVAYKTNMLTTDASHSNVPAEGGVWLTAASNLTGLPEGWGDSRHALARLYNGNASYSLDLLASYGYQKLAWRIGKEWKEIFHTGNVSELFKNHTTVLTETTTLKSLYSLISGYGSMVFHYNTSAVGTLPSDFPTDLVTDNTPASMFNVMVKRIGNNYHYTIEGVFTNGVPYIIEGYYSSSFYWRRMFTTAGGTLSGDLYIKKVNGTTETRIINYQNNTFLRNYTDDNNYKDLVIRETGLSYIKRENGNGSEHILLHAGNSNAVIKATTAPSNTTAVWVDTANKKVKAYIDGAWTVIA